MGLKRIATLASLLLLSLSVASCASSFPYKWYGVRAESYRGVLLGPSEKDDLPFTMCEPDEKDRGKCVVMLTAELHRLRSEYLQLKERLKSCEMQDQGAALWVSNFPYRWYGLGAESYQGVLLGPSEKDDLPLTTCEPDESGTGKCAVMLIAEFHRLRSEYLQLKERLKGCELQAQGGAE